MGTEEHTLVATDEYVKALAGRIRGWDVLELGVGKGALTQLILNAGANSVTGYEIVSNVCNVKDENSTL